MGVFTRLKDIVSSNINAMLDKAEDPEKLIKLMIQEMEDTLVEIKASCAGVMAASKRLGRELEETRSRVDLWTERSERAMAKGRAELAREALLEKRQYQERIGSLERESAQCEALVEQYQSDIAQLEEKLASAREKHRVLVRRHTRARRKHRTEKEIRRIETSDAWIRFEEFENRIERMEADAELVNAGRRSTLEEAFSELDRGEGIDGELETLREKVAPAANKADPVHSQCCGQ